MSKIESMSGTFSSIHTGEWEARNGAVCIDCGGFECPGVYVEDECTDELSGGIDRFRFDWGSGDGQPLTPDLEDMFDGQRWLERNGTDGYSFVVHTDSERDRLDKIVTLYLHGEVVKTETYTGELGYAKAQAHGMMMLHAATRTRTNRLTGPSPR